MFPYLQLSKLSYLGVIFVTSRRGNPMLLFHGWNFIRERARGPRTRWVCGRKRRQQCIATVTTVDNIVVKTYGFHNHS